MKPNILLYFLCGLNISCASVTVELKEPQESTTAFTLHSHYGLWGLLGSSSVDLNKACVEASAVQIQNHINFEDFLLALFTAGLYTPKSTKIWCEWPPGWLSRQKEEQHTPPLFREGVHVPPFFREGAHTPPFSRLGEHIPPPLSKKAKAL